MGADANARRFTGIAEIYDEARPKMPDYVTEVISNYLMRKPDLVIDLGCGTGLSALAWQNRCNRVIGIEPNDDMLKIAMQKQSEAVRFIKAFADRTTLADHTADAVVCSQSFHWMEPVETLREISRILKSGGVFATVDCDWPPVCDWRAEEAYSRLFEQINAVGARNDDEAHQWNKSEHLANMRKSGCFQYCREIVFLNRERGNAERFIALAKSQGGLQAARRKEPEKVDLLLQKFEKEIGTFLSKSTDFDFCYRMRIGVKK